MKNKLIVTSIVLASAYVQVELDLTFKFNVPTTPQISILRVSTPSPQTYSPPVSVQNSAVPALAVLRKPDFIAQKSLVSPKLLSFPVIKVEKAGAAKKCES